MTSRRSRKRSRKRRRNEDFNVLPMLNISPYTHTTNHFPQQKAMDPFQQKMLATMLREAWNRDERKKPHWISYENNYVEFQSLMYSNVTFFFNLQNYLDNRSLISEHWKDEMHLAIGRLLEDFYFSEMMS